MGLTWLNSGIMLKPALKTKVFRSQLNPNTTLPEERNSMGCVNVVLAVRKDNQYDESNTYLPKWDVVNAVYYNINFDKFEGWVDLEDILPPKELL